MTIFDPPGTATLDLAQAQAALTAARAAYRTAADAADAEAMTAARREIRALTRTIDRFVEEAGEVRMSAERAQQITQAQTALTRAEQQLLDAEAALPDVEQAWVAANARRDGLADYVRQTEMGWADARMARTRARNLADTATKAVRDLRLRLERLTRPED
jgi:chromosome segregation ATPase